MSVKLLDSRTDIVTYTSNAIGLRVAEDVDGAVTFAWDWATGVPELLSDGDALYLVGHETLGQFADEAWAYYLPDALGQAQSRRRGPCAKRRTFKAP